ncbi:hypothetical protein BHE74_00040995, partial [Ensete ventricosum]
WQHTMRNTHRLVCLKRYTRDCSSLYMFLPCSKRPMASYRYCILRQEKDKLVGEVIRFVLFKTHQNSGCPIKREELTQLITKNYRQRTLPALVINEAREKISSIFGYEMKELQRSRPSSNKQGRAPHQSVFPYISNIFCAVEAKSYVVRSQLPSDIYSKYIEDKKTSHMTGFTFVVISIVHLAGGKISEDYIGQVVSNDTAAEAD